MGILSDIHTFWSSTSGLNSALDSSKVYTGMVPSGMAMPYAVITPISNSPTFLTGQGYWTSYKFQISIFDTSPDNCSSIGDTIAHYFDIAKIGSGGMAAIRTNGPIFFVDGDTPQRTYHCMIEYELLTNQTI